MLDAGDPAPDFYLPSAADPSAEYMLSAAADAGPVVLAFVPDDETEARTLLDSLAGLDWAELADRISVFGIGQSESVTRSLAEAGLPFPVLYDFDGYVADLYGVADRARGEGTRRALVLADRRCTIRYTWQGDSASAVPPLDAFEDAVRAL